MFETGDGVPPDDKKALDDKKAQPRSVDLRGAVNWFREAAALGDAIAQRRLGEMYQAGKGVEADRHAAKVFIGAPPSKAKRLPNGAWGTFTLPRRG